MAPYTLIVIDVQDEFLGEIYNKSRLISNINKQIKIAQENNRPIILVEFDGHTTKEILTDKLLEYKRLHMLEKEDCDGSKEIVTYMLYNRLPTRYVNVCGIFSSECVQDSVIGLLKILYKSDISVIKKACSDSSSWQHLKATETMCEAGAIII